MEPLASCLALATIAGPGLKPQVARWTAKMDAEKLNKDDVEQLLAQVAEQEQKLRILHNEVELLRTLIDHHNKQSDGREERVTPGGR
jgi:hypothetical protein